VEQVESIGLFEGSLEAVLIDHFGVVEEGAWDGGDGDGGVVGAIVGV
jgi:hypothetical protein